MTGTVLVLGATGRFGRHAAEAFWNAGWRVRIHDRARGGLEDAARGADVIVNGWNPPYPQWRAEVPGLTAQVIAAARSSGATVILPGNVYVFGRDLPPLLGPGTPHLAEHPLGRVRVEMEAAYRASGVRTIVLRAGDFLDTEASGNWFDKVIAAGIARGRLVYPGPIDVGHAWAFLPDLARAAVKLVGMRGDLPVFAELPFAGVTLSGQDMAGLATQVLGRRVSVARMNWLPLQMSRPVWPMARHLLEMRYLWERPHALDDGPLAAVLPKFRATDPGEALARALGPLSGAGRMPEARRQARAA